MQPSALPFGALAFDRIGEGDYLPAIQAGMAQQLREVDAISNNPAPPTFDNTLVAMERTGRLLDRAMGAFSVEVQTNSDPALLRARDVIAPKLAAIKMPNTSTPNYSRGLTRFIRARLAGSRQGIQAAGRTNVLRVHAGRGQPYRRGQDAAEAMNPQLAVLQDAFRTEAAGGNAARRIRHHGQS